MPCRRRGWTLTDAMVNRSSPFLGAVLTPRAVRVMAAVVFASALAMPWLAWWGGAFGEAREVELPERIIEYRPALVALPGGRFWMGSTVEEQARAVAEAKDTEGAYRDELQHEAEVGDFELCRTEVTQGQWKAVMGVSECGEEACADEKPITGVSWWEAVKYLNRLTELENERRSSDEQLSVCYEKKSDDSVTWARGCTGYRLPTEAEWEYAARAGSRTTYFFGDDPKKLCDHANVGDLTAKAKFPDWITVECDDKVAGLAAVGSYTANAWGLHDVYGNAWEWVWDWYGDYNPKPPINYVGPETGPGRVVRGGSSWSMPRLLRSANRCNPAVANSRTGLRCARGLTPQLIPVGE